MKLVNPAMAGQKFVTSTGAVVADANGVIVVDDVMAQAFVNSGWKRIGAMTTTPVVDNGRVVDNGKEPDSAIKKVEPEKKPEQVNGPSLDDLEVDEPEEEKQQQPQTEKKPKQSKPKPKWQRN